VYFDEIFGYFPPHPANPPSKLLLLRLLKQARAFGVGLMLTTQNPVDLDYKGLTNAGTWFIGKLQTDRDKARVLEGLESVESAATADRAYFDRLISSLDSRVFILHNVHQDKPVTFMTRWAMSYLRGPLTKRQIRTLMEPYKEQLLTAEQRQAEIAQQPPPKPGSGFSAVPTRLGVDIPQYFLLVDTPLQRAVRQEEQQRRMMLKSKSAQQVYQPAVLAWATVHFHDARRKVDHSEQHAYLLPAPDNLAWVDWRVSKVTLDQGDMVDMPPGDALYADAPPSLGDAKDWRALQKDFRNFLYREARLPLYYSRPLRLYSEVGESQGRFVQRCQEQAAASRREQEDKINSKFERRLERLQDRLQREERELHADRVEYDGRKREETLSLGESVLGLFTGRRRSRAFSEASRRRRLTSQSRADVEESEEVIKQLEQQIEELRQEWSEALDELAQEAKEKSRQIEEVQIKPRKSDIDLTVFGVAWVPYWHVSLEDPSGAVQTAMLPAYRGRQE
jgi:hypothetical protein